MNWEFLVQFRENYPEGAVPPLTLTYLMAFLYGEVT